MKVIDFTRKKNENNLISGSLKDPLFLFTIEDNDNTRELALQMHGEFLTYIPAEMSFYDEEAWENYRILKEYLLSEKGREFLDRVNLDKDKFILSLYRVLVYSHSCFGWFKKRLLVILEYLKYYSGKFGG